MINISEIVIDPDFAQSYTVFRPSGYWSHGRYVITGEDQLSFFGPVLPSNMKEINTVPEGDRVTGMMTFYTQSSSPFKLSRDNSEEGMSDQVVWHNERYKIIQIFSYDDFGYQKAIGVRLSGA